MELNDFKALLKSGSLGGVYVFAGEEDYLKQFYLSELRHRAVTDESLTAFNHSVYDGAQIDFSSVAEDMTSPPMFEEYKLVEWKYPDLDKMKEGELDRLEELIDLTNDTGYGILALLVADGAVDLGTAKKAGKFAARFGDKVRMLTFNKSTDAQLLSWLKKHFDAEGVQVNSDVLGALIFRAGHSMSVLNNEVIKLCMLAKARGVSRVTAEDVERAVSSTLECETFAFSNAILEKNKRAAFLALEDMRSQRQDPILILGILAKTLSDITSIAYMLRDGTNQSDIQSVTKMNPYKLKLYIASAKKYGPDTAAKILAELARVDTGAKYGGVSGYTAIEMFISKCI